MFLGSKVMMTLSDDGVSPCYVVTLSWALTFHVVAPHTVEIYKNTFNINIRNLQNLHTIIMFLDIINRPVFI
jgi:hypothetical protein